uniref:ATP-dependent helicase ATRX n=2 Tax=Anthurium amnicola TaxID=1678845 RepID=A0A1D1Z2M2_9ARAE
MGKSFNVEEVTAAKGWAENDQCVKMGVEEQMEEEAILFEEIKKLADIERIEPSKKEMQDIEMNKKAVIVNENKEEDVEVEELREAEDDVDSDSSDSFICDSKDELSAYGTNDESSSEAPLTDGDVEELVTEFLEVESKAAEAQESLEKESLTQVENDVRAELAETFQGEELETAVSTEMKIYIEQWETVLDELETESSLLLEQLDGAGVELPTLYKWIESQVPECCSTEAWKRRAHWAGCQVTSEIDEAIHGAENYLHSHRPVRRHHGKVMEEGASGFLTRKLTGEESCKSTGESSEQDWSLFNRVLQSNMFSENGASFGSKNWASVYLASTPQQAASMGLNLPGVDEVEEIDDVQIDSYDPFYADAIANEKGIDLSEEQRKNFRKVREEDDARITRKLQLHLKERRHRKQQYQKDIRSQSRKGDLDRAGCGMKISSQVYGEYSASTQSNSEGLSSNEAYKEKCIVDGSRSTLPASALSGECLQPHSGGDLEMDNKRRTVIIDSDDEVQVIEKMVTDTCMEPEIESQSAQQVEELVDIIDVDVIPSPSSSCCKDNIEKFCCTACSKVLRASDVCRHPLLDVITCETCNSILKRRLHSKDSGSSENFCGWCGKCDDLVKCTSCEMSFCTACIQRNFGEECILVSKVSSWQCYCCSPMLLQQFIVDCDKALGRFAKTSSVINSESSDSDVNHPISNKKRRKRKIRRILDDAELGEETKQKIAIEKARQEHLKSMQFSGQSLTKATNNLNGATTKGADVQVLGDAIGGYVVNVAREEDEQPVRIPLSLSAKLKPHQVSGIRFMWENIMQSVRKVKSGDKGLGCILAHTMGLGKTFQVIAFLYTAMRSVDLGLRTALIVTPVNVLHNWRQEFRKWRPLELKTLRVFMLEDVPREKRVDLLSKWKAKGGVLLIGYATFRNLSLGKHVKDRNIAVELSHSLQYGPDILVCDEAHMIKNRRADITQALKQVRTQRRIALTGSPLQNNLMEYYCMVDFVREGFLGSSHEFRNRFQNPIENGQHANSTSVDVKIMNQRSHILYEQLKGFVQRMDLNVVKKDLPPKTVFVITVKLSPLQRKLYKRFLDVHGFTSNKVSSEKALKQSCFFAGYQALAQIWNHPGLLQMTKQLRDSLRREDAMENFLTDYTSSDDNIECGDLLNGDKQKSKNDYMQKKGDSIFFHEETDWWEDLLHEKIYKEVDYSGKMVLLLDILCMSYEAGDKALVFSQSLPTLDLIELFLSKLPRKEREGKFWKQGKDWYRLDGRTDGLERQRLVENFNDPTNKRVKCTLISTRAGSLGINLHAANRVIIVDGSWNPTNDLQAIYRVWRYGQNKPVYAYRLMAHGTMEEKIYKRQVTKEGLAARVVDRQQIYRTMSKEDVLHLFDFGDDETADYVPDQSQISAPNQDRTTEVVGLLKQNHVPLSHSISISDKFMETLLSRHYPCWIANYHEHETLLQENEEERLSKEEQDMAWEIFQRTLEWEEVQRVSFDDSLALPLDQKPVMDLGCRQNSSPQQSKSSMRSRHVPQRKCSNLSHLLTLRSQGTKSGCSTVCGECSQEISWESLNRDGKSR